MEDQDKQVTGLQRQAERNWNEGMGPVSFLEWSDRLKELSYGMKLYPLSVEVMDCTIRAAWEGMDRCPELLKLWEGVFPEGFEREYGEAGFFFRLITRSPKDWGPSAWAVDSKPMPMRNVKGIVNACLGSVRVFDDLMTLRFLPEVAYAVIRPYEDFSVMDEWRVFVKDGKIEGISQYYYEVVWEGHGDPGTIEGDLRRFMEEVIREMKVKTFVADLVWSVGGVKLLETNPWGLSDPCLFGRYENLDGKMLIRFGGTGIW